MKTIFQKDYDGESMYDMNRDFCEAFMEVFNPVIGEIPQDQHGFLKGTFKVTVEWSDDGGIE